MKRLERPPMPLWVKLFALALGLVGLAVAGHLVLMAALGVHMPHG